jgi:hypothetical protein
MVLPAGWGLRLVPWHMSNGLLLFADEVMASIRRKFQKHGFKEMVM